MAKTITAVISDTHIGSTTALSLKSYTTDEGQEIKATPAQEWLLSSWLDYCDYLKALAGITGRKRAHRLIVVHLGDVVDFSKARYLAAPGQVRRIEV